MGSEADSTPLLGSRPCVDANGPGLACTAQLAPDTAPATAKLAPGAPGVRAAFELDETETAALVGAHEARAAAEPRVVNPVAGQEPMPIWVIPLLVTAVCAVSSAGAVFKLMETVPPLSLAAWRLQITTVLLVPGCVINFRSLPLELQQRTLRSYRSFIISGTSLALHFGCWVRLHGFAHPRLVVQVWGIEHTSLIHSYLCMATTPIFIAGGTWVLRRPISRTELGGTALGTFGTVLLTLGPAAKGSQVTLAGDLVTLCAAVAVISYLEVGQRLRTWMPVFLYACPVTGVAACVLTMGGIFLEGTSFSKLGAGGVFGWLSAEYLLEACYLGIVPGIVGHAGFNTVLKYISPLVISLSFTTEPLIGACIGYFILGVMSAPNVFIYIGGGIILCATGTVTVAQHRRNLKASAAARLSEPFTKVPFHDFSVEEDFMV